MKKRLEALVTCFDAISESIENTVLDVSSPDVTSVEGLNTPSRNRLDDMIRRTMAQLNDSNQSTGGTTEPQGAAIELF